jgi:ABC-type uncharacterized transport system permease subunit
MVYFAFIVAGALAGLAGISEVSGAIGQLRPTISPGYGFTAIIVAFLGRLNPLGIVAAGLILALTYLGGEAAQISIGITDKVTASFPGAASVLRTGLRYADSLPHPDHHRRGAKRECRVMDMTQAILLTVMTAATPLLIAAIGELVVERSGVLNLGVEGMMIMGAVAAFASGADDRIGRARRNCRRHHCRHCHVFASVRVLGPECLSTNQVATGLALTILGIGISPDDRRGLHRRFPV